MKFILSQERKGFTLLEVMVAMAIVGVSVGIFFSMVGNSSKIRGKIDDHANSLLLARTKTEESFLGILEGIYTMQDEKRIYEGITEKGIKWKILEIDKYKEARMKQMIWDEDERELPPEGYIALNTQVEGINIDTVTFIEQTRDNTIKKKKKENE